MADTIEPRLAEPRERGISFRSVIVACALIPANALWVAEIELIWYTGHPTCVSLFFNVVFILVWIALANLIVKRYWPHRAFSRAELMTIYIVLSISSTLVSHDFLQVFTPMVAYPTYAASPENRWDEFILPHVPEQLIVTDKEAATGLASGGVDPYQWKIIRAWLRPLGYWTTFILALVMGLLCLTVIFRQQWIEKERLSYPVIQIPLEIAGSLGKLLRNRLFWYGFILTAGIDIVNGLHSLYPNIPEIPIANAFEFREYLVRRPWSAIGYTVINLYPFAIGLCFFLPTDLVFSCWFFFLVWKGVEVASAAAGVRDMPGFPFILQQTAGGYMGLALIAIWLSRRHLKAVILKVLGRADAIDDSREPIRYRTAVLGFILCSAYLIGFGMWAGASFKVMLVFFGIFFLYSIAIARMRAELGPPAHDLHGADPGRLMTETFGNRQMGASNMAVFSLLWFFNRAYRAHPSPHSLEAFKIGERLGLPNRRVLIALIIALVVGLLASYWALLHVLYVNGYTATQSGAGMAFATETWNRMNGWVRVAHKPNYPAGIAVVLGVIVSLVLAAGRMRFSWWLFHPVGFATSASWSMGKLWFCMFLGWLIKVLITRYGGARAYRRAVPFFIGLVLGEFMMISLWSIYGAVKGVQVYHFWG